MNSTLSDDLMRLSEELERISKRVADTVADGSGTPSQNVTASDVRRILRARRLRDRFFGSKIFADPAWDMMLELFAAHLDGKSVPVSSLCCAASVPPTTALRWIAKLTTVKVMVREPDPNDARRVYVRLSKRSLEQLESYLDSARRSFGEIMI